MCQVPWSKSGGNINSQVPEPAGWRAGGRSSSSRWQEQGIVSREGMAHAGGGWWPGRHDEAVEHFLEPC